MEITIEFLTSIGFNPESSRGNKYSYRELTWFDNSKELWLGMRKLYNVTTQADVLATRYVLGSDKNDKISFSFANLLKSWSDEFKQKAKENEIRSDIHPDVDLKIQELGQHLEYASDCARQIDLLWQH